MIEPRSRVLLGCERTQVLDEHLRWLNGRQPSKALQELDHDPRNSDSPIAAWSRVNSRQQAIVRARRRPLRRPSRLDDAPPLIDEVDWR
jgi:hypothetical protein